MDQKPLLYLVPGYIGSLKYFAKLAPHLSQYFQIEFLIVRRCDNHRKQMEEYLKENKYIYYIVDSGLKYSGIRIPFFTPIFGYVAQILSVRKFLKENKPRKIVLAKNLPPHHTIVKEANRLSVYTIMLQWSYGGNKEVSKMNIKKLPRFQKFYYNIVDWLYNVVDFILGGTSYVNSLGTIDKVGVMNEEAIEVIEDRCGIPPEKMKLVGIVDHQIIHELKERVEKDGSFKKSLESKYNITPKKKTILVLVWGLHKRKRWGFSVEEHLDYFRSMVESIRKSFPKDNTDVVLKLHPGDDVTLYDSFKDLSVKIFGDEAETEELLCISDLCILDPWTAANIWVIASGIPVMFINYSRLDAINVGKELYKLKKVTTSKEEFESLLNKFKSGEFESQYNERDIDIHAIDKTIALIQGEN